ncbi:hypothetical protein GCM10027168_44290 [Streptomyces capparidis]
MAESDKPSTASPQDPPHPYTETALARLMLSSAYREVADFAMGGVPTHYDNAEPPQGQYVEEAARLVHLAEEVLRRAVIYERERHTSWEEIGEALGITKQSAHKRFAGDVERWREPFDQPDHLRSDGTPADERIPHHVRYTWGSTGPEESTAESTARDLEQWLREHTAPSDSWAAEEHPVTGRLPRHSTTAMLLLADRLSSRLLEDQLVPDPQAQAALCDHRVALYSRLIREGDAPPEIREWIEKDRARAAALRATPGRGVTWDAMGN